jgi:TPR repeat protein
MYDKGFGVTQNVILAYKWLNLAARKFHAAARCRGLQDAQLDLARAQFCAENAMTPAPQNRRGLPKAPRRPLQ